MSTTTISIDRFRRRKQATSNTVDIAPAHEAPQHQHPLVGATLGLRQRRYGLMSSDEAITVAEVVGTSGDLAVTDRLAFIAALERHTAIVVIQVDGWYVACTTERVLEPADLATMRPAGDNDPRVMSLVTDRGITPALGPLVA